VAPLPRIPEIVARARTALQRGDTRALFAAARDAYRHHGAEFDSGLTLRTHGPQTLSSLYDEDANQILLAEAAHPDAEPRQIAALATALFYGVRPLPEAGQSVAERASLVNVVILLLAAHEQAHYLRAQYFNTQDESDHYRAEALCNRLAVAVVRFLAAHDREIARALARARAFFTSLAREMPATVADYPPPSEDLPAWFNRHYLLLLRNEPGIYFAFQLRFWLQYLEEPGAPLERLVDEEILEGARRYHARVRRPPWRTRVRTLRTIPGRRFAEVFALGEGGALLVDAEGGLKRIGERPRTFRAPGLPYPEAYESNYATWPGGHRLYAFQWEPGTLAVFEVTLDAPRAEARPSLLGTYPVAGRVVTISHDPAGNLYFLARDRAAILIYRLEARRRLALWRRLPHRPPGHRDGPVEAATFTLGAFAVTDTETVVFYDPASYALREVDETGEVRTLAGSLRGLRDGDGEDARLSRVTSLAPFDDGIWFLDRGTDGLRVRRLEIRRPWRRR
jgi:hypothetical protein